MKISDYIGYADGPTVPVYHVFYGCKIGIISGQFGR